MALVVVMAVAVALAVAVVVALAVAVAVAVMVAVAVAVAVAVVAVVAKPRKYLCIWCGARLGASKSNALKLILRLFLYHFLHTMSS